VQRGKPSQGTSWLVLLRVASQKQTMKIGCLLFLPDIMGTGVSTRDCSLFSFFGGWYPMLCSYSNQYYGSTLLRVRVGKLFRTAVTYSAKTFRQLTN
jgi:hypothetical protein